MGSSIFLAASLRVGSDATESRKSRINILGSAMRRRWEWISVNGDTFYHVHSLDTRYVGAGPMTSSFLSFVARVWAEPEGQRCGPVSFGMSWLAILAKL